MVLIAHIPKGIIEKRKILFSFLWTGKRENEGISLVKWSNIRSEPPRKLHSLATPIETMKKRPTDHLRYSILTLEEGVGALRPKSLIRRPDGPNRRGSDSEPLRERSPRG